MFAGIFPPLPTPFRGNGDLDLGLLTELVARRNGAGLAGYVALGSNGEAVHVAADEAEAVVRCVRASAAPRLRVIAGAGHQSTRATVEASRRAAGAGADAVLVLTPSYYRAATSPEALRRHYEAVADAASVPVLVYNVPGNTGFHLPVEVAAALAPHPNVAGMKDSAGDAAQLTAFVAATRDVPSFEVLTGSFGTLVSGLEAGAVGGILAVANVVPEACVAILRHVQAGRRDEAAALHARVLPLARAVTVRWGVPGVKAAMDLLGIPCGAPRAPLLPLDAAARAELAGFLRAAGAEVP